MASRWTDSGIDWANLDLHKERTSWVIDELYRATLEKESIMRYMRNIDSSVSSWDSLESLRDYEKINSIIEKLSYWLEPVYASGTTNGEYSFFDHVADPVADWTANIGTYPFFGAKWLDLSVGGNLELTVGSLSLIRDWSIGSTRIGSDLLQLIYDVLEQLNQVFATGERGANPQSYLTGKGGALGTPLPLSTDHLGQDNDFATAVAEYDASSVLEFGSRTQIVQKLPQGTGGAGNIKLSGTYCTWGDGFSPRDSGDNVISMNGGSFSIVWFWGDNAKTEFPSITYDVFAVNNNVGGVVSEGVPIVPFGGFIDDSAEYWAITLSLLIIDLDEHVVEYY